ncbi:MAG: hypothetical protein QOG79_4652 [Mycobacterium sp.]|nr:hypothetical protein [Mycobacterium sp.]
MPGATYSADAGGLQVGGKAIETAVGVTTDAEAIAALKAKGIAMASKTLKLDLGALVTELNATGEFFGHDKVEGLATPDGGNTLMIANDSDFGLAGLASEPPPFTLKPKTLANGSQDACQDQDDDGFDQGRVLTERPGPPERPSTSAYARIPKCADQLVLSL